MEPKQLIPDLELCKRLKELGWKGETYFRWERDIFDDSPIITTGVLPSSRIIALAPTSEELGEILRPNYIGDIYHVVLRLMDDKYLWTACEEDTKSGELNSIDAIDPEEKEVNVRAKMVIWLIENGHLKLETA